MSHLGWKGLPILSLMVFCGCSQNYEIDLRKVNQLEGFKWNGVIRVQRVQHSILDTPGMSRVELLSQNNRSVLIVADGGDVKAYLELKVKPVEPPSSQPAESIAPLDVQLRTD